MEVTTVPAEHSPASSSSLADDAVLLGESEEELDRMVGHFDDVCICRST